MKKLFFIITLSVNCYFFSNTIVLSGELSVASGEVKQEYKKGTKSKKVYY